MKITGAGGTPGGIGSFIIGFIMMCTGFYLLLQSIVIMHPWGLGMGLYSFMAFGGPVSITSGMLLVPIMIGIGIIFFNARNIIGWALALCSLAALIVGVLVNIQFTLRAMTFFDLLAIFILSIGGLGLFLRSLMSREGNGPAAP